MINNDMAFCKIISTESMQELQKKIKLIYADIILGTSEKNPVIEFKEYLNDTLIVPIIKKMVEWNTGENSEKLYLAYCLVANGKSEEEAVKESRTEGWLLHELLELKPVTDENRHLFVIQKPDFEIKKLKRKKVKGIK